MEMNRIDVRRRPTRFVAAVALTLALAAAARAQQAVPAVQPAPPAPAPAAPAPIDCKVNLKLTGVMRDILSNALNRGAQLPSDDVSSFLASPTKYATGDELLKAAAAHFKMDEKKLAELVDRFRHVNCEHAPVPGYVAPDSFIDAAQGSKLSPLPDSPFARNVTLHVVLHELGHAVVREFDIPVLGNEETMADAFATHVLVEHLPEQALDALRARVASLLVEADEVPRDQWSVRGEHDNDARRAYQIAALAVAADATKYAPVAALVGMTPRDISRARDYGADIHRAWRRTLAPLMMPRGRESTESRFAADDVTRAFITAGSPTLETSITTVLRMIDWHSRVTVAFIGAEGGAAWSRSNRTVTVNSEYVRRFIAQGVKAEAHGWPSPPPAPESR